jgi:hypothetical protein
VKKKMLMVCVRMSGASFSTIKTAATTISFTNSEVVQVIPYQPNIFLPLIVFCVLETTDRSSNTCHFTDIKAVKVGKICKKQKMPRILAPTSLFSLVKYLRVKPEPA